MTTADTLILPFDELGSERLAEVGGKNASLGELIRTLAGKEDLRVPDGFALTATAYWHFIHSNDLHAQLQGALDDLQPDMRNLAKVGARLRQLVLDASWPDDLTAAVADAYRALSRRAGKRQLAVAVRSSATAEDLPDASFAGQHDSFLNIRGVDALLAACQHCLASLFTDRAISYRESRGFAHMKVALSVGVQQMVRADQGGAGVMFTIDTETGFDKVMRITAAWGLGENVVQGTVNPDEHLVFKPLLQDRARIPIIDRQLGSKAQKMVYRRLSRKDLLTNREPPTQNRPTTAAERARYVLSDDEALQLARWGQVIEQHYGMPMDIEWARDGREGPLYIVQARPETIESGRDRGRLRTWQLGNRGPRLLRGLAIGAAAVSGPVCVIRKAADIERFVDGAVLVTTSTDPDWVPVMKRAAAIVTDHGGRTSHAAIVSRELGLPAVVGTGKATETLKGGQVVTVSCAEGDQGFVYDGEATITVQDIDLSEIPSTDTKVMLNLASPAAALNWWRLPADGVGLARMEFVISNHIRIHPMALLHPEQVDRKSQRLIRRLTKGYADPVTYFVDRLAQGLARIAAVAYPHPVIVRMSDFKTNEYANLIGGAAFEPQEENPMLGFRGASRYYSDAYRDGFALECRGIRQLREQMGLDNVKVMIPFCRSVKEADRVLAVMAEEGLVRGQEGLEVYVMCEVPSNVVLASDFAKRFDGFSIGSNDLTQLTLGVDRDSATLAELFDEQDDAVKWMISTVIKSAHEAGVRVGLCGQAPSDHPAFAGYLVDCGIDSISVTPDSFVAVKQHVAAAESARQGAAD